MISFISPKLNIYHCYDFIVVREEFQLNDNAFVTSIFFLPYLFFPLKFHNVPRIHRQTKHLIPVAEKERRAYVLCEQYRMARTGRTKKYQNERDDVCTLKEESHVWNAPDFLRVTCARSFFFSVSLDAKKFSLRTFAKMAI